MVSRFSFPAAASDRILPAPPRIHRPCYQAKDNPDSQAYLQAVLDTHGRGQWVYRVSVYPSWMECHVYPLCRPLKVAWLNGLRHPDHPDY